MKIHKEFCPISLSITINPYCDCEQFTHSGGSSFQNINKAEKEIDQSNLWKCFRCSGCLNTYYVPIEEETIPNCNFCDSSFSTGTTKELVNIINNPPLKDNK